MYNLLHNVEVGMGFTQPRAKDPRIVKSITIEHMGIQPTCTMAIGYRKCTITNFDWTVYLHLLGGGYEIYSPQIEQFDWTV